MPQHLMPEIGARIYHYGGGFILHPNAGSQPVIFSILGRTYFAATADHGNPTAGAGAKKSNM